MGRKMLFSAIAALSLVATVTPSLALQCVPFARQISGINIHGNAKTWWGQAAGRFDRGVSPKVGSVMAFKPIKSMPIGHVATVSKIVSDREVLVDHANWSRINGHRGQIERGARVLDVSEAGDWSKVRVWYAPMRDLGGTTYPLYGFIYNRSGSEASAT
jgi:surface antigen